ncbi:MAG: ferredoxin [Fimbriimonadales bacterium]|nr:MAG: ferredoxin [Fimbriimonadales bacterium]
MERKIGDLTVSIDRDLCIGSGNCVKIAPEVFVLDETSTTAFRDGELSCDRDRLIEACRVCPTNALRCVDDAGNILAPEEG